MRSLFLIFLSFSTAAAIQCYRGEFNATKGTENYKVVVCDTDVNHCSLEIRNQSKYYRCGKADGGVCENEGCHKRIKEGWEKCCCKDNLCNLKKPSALETVPQLDGDAPAVKMTREDMCMLGTAPVRGFNTNRPTGIKMRKRRCPTLCMRTVKQSTHYQKYFQLSCATNENDCQGKPICQNKLAGLPPVDCCCKGSGCNGLPWAVIDDSDEEPIHVNPPRPTQSKPDREIPSHPRIIVEEREDDGDDDDVQLSEEYPPFKLILKKLLNPKKLKVVIMNLIKFFVELLQACAKPFSGKQYSVDK